MKILALGDFQGVFSEKLKKKLAKEEFDLILGTGDYSGIDAWRPYIMYMFKMSKQKKQAISPKQYFGNKKYKDLIKKDYRLGKSVLKKLNSLNKPVFYIFGNTDDEWYQYPFEKTKKASKIRRNFLKKLSNMKEITYSKTKFGKISIIGFGGYMDIEAFLNKKELNEDIEKIKERKLRLFKSKNLLFKNIINTKHPRLFLFHYPPKGVFDIIQDGKQNPMNGKSAGVSSFKQAIKKYKPVLVLCGHMHEYQGAKKLYDSVVINPGDAKSNKYAVIELDDKLIKIKKIKFAK